MVGWDPCLHRCSSGIVWLTLALLAAVHSVLVTSSQPPGSACFSIPFLGVGISLIAGAALPLGCLFGSVEESMYSKSRLGISSPWLRLSVAGRSSVCLAWQVVMGNMTFPLSYLRETCGELPWGPLLSVFDFSCFALRLLILILIASSGIPYKG